MLRKLLAAACFALCVASSPAKAVDTATAAATCGSQSYTAGYSYGMVQDLTGLLCVSASVSASVTGFAPATFGSLTATASSSASTALPAGANVALENTSTVAVSCVLDPTNAVATTNKIVVPGGSTVFVTVGSNTKVACINQTGSASNVVALMGGAGLGTNFGGGGGGGSGGTSSSFSAAFPATGTAIGINDGTNMQSLQAAIALGDGVNGNNTAAVASWLWNGTTYDRAKGDATNGAFVNVKTSVLPTGAATAALQGTNSATTAHTCSTGGYSILGCLGQIDDDVKGSVAAGTNTIGAVGADPSLGKATPTFKALSMNTATTTEIIPLSGTTVTYVTHIRIMAGGTANITFKYGTGTNCGTGTTTLDGPYPMTAQVGFTAGNGSGPVLIVPSGKALCVTSDAAVQVTTGMIEQQI